MKTFEEFVNESNRDLTGRGVYNYILELNTTLNPNADEAREKNEQWLKKNWKPKYNDMIFNGNPNHFLLYKKLERMKDPRAKKRGGYRSFSIKDINKIIHDDDWSDKHKYTIDGVIDKGYPRVYVIGYWFLPSRPHTLYFIEDKGIFTRSNVPQSYLK